MLASIDIQIVVDRIIHPDHVFLKAMWTTIYISVVAQVIGVLLGLGAALMLRSRLWPLRTISSAYVLVLRGTPIIVQIFFIYFGTNLLFGFALIPNSVNLGLFTMTGAVLAGIAALAINEGAYMREIIRAGIDSVDGGQLEAARSLGMTSRLAMRRIILPQAARVIVPPLGNEFNTMLKTTSLLAFIGVYEMFEDADVHYSASFKPVEYFTAVAFWYLVLTSAWALVQASIERRLAVGDRDRVLSFRERIVAAWAPVGSWARTR